MTRVAVKEVVISAGNLPEKGEAMGKGEPATGERQNWG